MGGVAAVAGAVAAAVGLVLYLYRRHDAPAAVLERNDERRRYDFDEFDRALGVRDAESLTRMFSGLDDSVRPVGGLRPEDGDSPGRQGDTGAS